MNRQDYIMRMVEQLSMRRKPEHYKLLRSMRSTRFEDSTVWASRQIAWYKGNVP